MVESTTSEVLFSVTKENLETGLRGYPVGYCITSTVDPQKGLFYVGHSLADIAYWDPENVIFLLLYGKEGSTEEIKAFKKQLVERSHLSKEVIKHIHQLPKNTHPMRQFKMALLLLGSIEGKEDYREDALNLIAKVPELAAVVINYHAGWGETPASKPELGYMENFAQMLRVPNANAEQLTHILRLFNVLHYDHGGGNLSAFTGKAISSGLEDLYGSITGAMCALAGPRHGKANQDCLEFLRSLEAKLGGDVTEQQLEDELLHRLADHQVIYGFGHAVLRVEDPRATLLYAEGEKHFPNSSLIKLALKLRKVGPRLLMANSKTADPYPNVDAISGAVLAAAGFNYPQYFTVLFGIARCVGISRQIIYERLEARDGKGVPIYRPKFIYKGA